ncbi:glycoside hydrolase family 108 protein [Devosia sp. SL43]|uniref:glycoside hydrolase family 108 protein n=1 Tax=Devosia sp. SL43 TaxID=2806348 RepID=UPI001F463309|nr:glycosyl hydrolase 108 family protein [Devosia sp. SL43]UJW87945.1 glycoside hydrolase family 108 protein [Devosia sp. SL43]
MAKGNFPACLADVLVHEGGYTNNPKDPGNWTGGKVGSGTLKGTKKGIAAASYPALDIKNLSDAKIAELYEANYWRKIRGDDLPSGVDLSTMDYGVNSGPSRSAKELQRVVGVEADGRIGPVTILAVKAADPRVVIKGHCGRRMSFLRGLAIWNTFGRGWSTRVANVEAKALSWVSSKSQLEADAKAARDKAVAQGSGAAVGTGGGIGADQAPDLSWLPVWAIVAVVAAIVVPLVIRTIINAQRAQALASVAKEA